MPKEDEPLKMTKAQRDWYLLTRLFRFDKGQQSYFGSICKISAGMVFLIISYYLIKNGLLLGDTSENIIWPIVFFSVLGITFTIAGILNTLHVKRNRMGSQRKH